jgi:hypothetical protein
MERSGSFLPPYVSARGIARCLTALLLLAAALSSIAAGFEISEILLIVSASGGMEANEETHWLYSRARNIMLVIRVVFVAAITAVFFAWFHRARVNVRAFGCRRFRFPRIWTVLSFLVPIVNLFRPYQILSEVWRASDPRSIGSAVEWKLMPLPRIVSAWWGVLLASVGFELAAILLMMDVSGGNAHFALSRGTSTVAHLASTAACILAYLVVSSIGRFQQTKWAILSHESQVLSEFASPKPTAAIPADALTANSI